MISPQFLCHSLSTTETQPHEARYQSIWKGSYPKKIKFFMREISHDSIRTVDIIQRKSPWLCLNPIGMSLSIEMVNLSYISLLMVHFLNHSEKDASLTPIGPLLYPRTH